MIQKSVKTENMWHMYEKRNQTTKYEMQVHNTVVIPEFFINWFAGKFRNFIRGRNKNKKREREKKKALVGQIKNNFSTKIFYPQKYGGSTKKKKKKKRIESKIAISFSGGDKLKS